MIRHAIVATFALFAGCDPQTEVRPQSGDAVAHGRALFHDPAIAGSDANEVACADCHATGEAPDARILPGSSLAGVVFRPTFWGGAENDLLRSVNHCRSFFMLADKPWTADDVDARAMYAYLESLSQGPDGREPQPFTVVASIVPVAPGDAVRGIDVYASSCFPCHGARSTGVAKQVARAPILPDQTLADHPLGEYTEEERRAVFIEKIRHGGFLGYGGQMPPYSEEVLSEEALADLVAYLGLP